MTTRKNKVKGKGKALHGKRSNRKLLKYIELDHDNTFTVSTNKDERDHYTLGELYQVTNYKEGDLEFVFTGVKKIVADIELTPEINDLLQKVVAHDDIPKVEAYVAWAILRSLEADVDYIFQGKLREQYIAVIEKAERDLKP
ncbi:MAG: hypothetical protein E6L03_10885 [Thaumarchaeota archaeon]|nr:MAG: hypothetical protein E6L03_10885 [Nitrososphaerota archaeon]